MGKAGDGVVVARLGPTTTVSFRATKATTIEEAPNKVHKQWGAAKSANPGVITRCHGGSGSMPADAQCFP